MEPKTLLCFGGPMDGKIVAVDRVPLLAVVHEYAPGVACETPTSEFVPYSTVRYDLARFGVNGGDSRWIGECLVTDEYPEDRISDSLTAILGAARAVRHALGFVTLSA